MECYMKPFVVVFSLLLGASLLGCKKEDRIVDTVVWQNDVPHDLAVAVFADNGLWNFVLPQTGTVIGNS